MKTVALVLKEGKEYNASIALWLINQLPSDVHIDLFTDSKTLLRSAHLPFRVRTIPLTYNYDGWWSKMELFAPGTITSPTLYMDLDTCVFNLPDKYWQGGGSVVLDDFFFPHKAASGLMLIHPDDTKQVWDEWIKQPSEWMKMYKAEGDQGFIGSHLRRPGRWQRRFPKEIISYKAQLKEGHKFYDPSKGSLDTANIVCFHGQPRPWNTEETWLPPRIT